MRSRFLRALIVCTSVFALLLHGRDDVRASASGVVISEFRVRGPQGGNDEFIELYNASAAPVAIGGWKINGSNNAAGTSTRATIAGGVTLNPGCHYLVVNTAASGYSGSVAGDQTYTIGVTDDGGIALLTAANAIVDAVGMSAGSAYKEGAILASLGSTNADRGYERKPGGASGSATDTDNNATDFALITPSAPQNSASTCVGGGDTAPSVSNTTPVNNATGVAVSANITITFSENVTTTANAFALECPAGTAKAFTQSGSGSSTITLDPTGNLPAGTNCAVTVFANEITDTDGQPDHMTADRTFSFMTANPSDTAPSVSSTSPAGSATNVPADSTIVINFSESVSATGSAFTIECPTGSFQGLTQSASPSASITLTPTSPLPYSTTCRVTVSALQISDTDPNDPPDNLVSDVSFSFTTAAAPPPGAGKVIINEIDADTPGSDIAEFIELYDGGVGNTPLDGLVVVLYNGTDPDTLQNNDKRSYAAFDLDGYMTNASGYFVLGNPGVASAQLLFDPGQFGLLQNGPDAVALYIGSASDFPANTNVTTTNLLDAIVYGTNDPSPTALLPLTPNQLIVNEDANGAGVTESSQRCPNGMGGIRNNAAYRQAAPTPGAANSCPANRPPSDVVISQLYGGGGNTNATFHNDYIELFNRSTTTAVDLSGWSVQYASSTGNGWSGNLQPLGGTIGPLEYYLIALGTGGGGGANLPPANVTGQINMSGTTGKVALVDSFDPLVGNCPIFNGHVRDFVGYGAADCGEGGGTAPSLAGNNGLALLRQGSGAVDTDKNTPDFATGAPNPRRTAIIVELGPFVLLTDPRNGAPHAPRDATIQVTFTEPVDVFDPWFDVACSATGHHTDATFAGTGRDHYITPNVNFQAGETCTVTIMASQVHDQDLDDGAPNTDTLRANYVWSFTVADGTAPPYPSSVHLTFGNPSNAGSDPLNYLMEKPEFALSYNSDMGRPNWVSWHLSDEWIGTLTREDTFRPDPAVPPDWYRVQSFDFAGSGFDRGHMTPNADRDKETSIPINQATFLMTNMVAQAPANNQGPWAALEGDLRTIVDQGNEVYIIAGPSGTGGTGSNGGVTMTLADGHVTVPAWTWKVALVLPKDSGDDFSRVSCTTRTITVIMPNTQSVNSDWKASLTTVDAVETLTGYDILSNLPEPIQNCVEARKDGDPALPLVPGTQTITFAPLPGRVYGDAPFTVSATGGKSGQPVTFLASGACMSDGLNGRHDYRHGGGHVYRHRVTGGHVDL